MTYKIRKIARLTIVVELVIVVIRSFPVSS